MKPKINLDLKRKSVPQLIELGNHIVASMTGNANFPTPHPALAAVTTAITTLQNADTAALGGGAALKSVMHQKQEVLNQLLTQLALYVEGIVNDPSVADANKEVMILSSGMQMKTLTHPQHHVFGVKHGSVSGSIDLRAEGIERGMHNWEYAMEPSMANGWHLAPATMQAHTTINGLTVGAQYSFRHRAVTKEGEQDWGQPLSIVVV
ncbi:MAG: hypothetical protein HY064_13430 [Bacteroidetes bacterium]|nr:hypothetical protein [Bacteroidota bacterium]